VKQRFSECGNPANPDRGPHSDKPTLPANLCPFSGRAEFARLDHDFGEAVGEPVEATARSVVWQRAAEHLQHMLSSERRIDHPTEASSGGERHRRLIADTTLAALLAELPWERRISRMYGKDVSVPRMEVWVADHAYTYSHRTYQPISWTRTLLTLKVEVEAAAGGKCNSALINRYENEKDSVGWHADNEPEMSYTGARRRCKVSPTIRS
jgi:hypothetical protein